MGCGHRPWTGLGLSQDHVCNMENQGFPGSESSQLNLIKLTYPPSCLPTIDLFLYCIDVRVHDSGHSYSNIDITIFRDHEPIRVEHSVTRCVALVPSINNMRGQGQCMDIYYVDIQTYICEHSFIIAVSRVQK